MRLLATSTLLTLSVIAASAGPALAKLTPAAEEDVGIENARWLAGLESWQQSFEASETEADTPQRSEPQAPDVKTVPVYIIRWFPGQ
jgi:hypothetical protein